LAAAHLYLGIALQQKGRLDDAIAQWQKTIELDPKLAAARIHLGSALGSKGLVDEAIVEFQKAIELDPKLAAAHLYLGIALQQKGRLDDAIAQWQKTIEIDPKLAAARANLTHWKPIAALQSKLPALLEGRFQPQDNAERLQLAQSCIYNKYYRAAAKLFADAFAAEPKRADDLFSQDRYSAACCAALTVAGQGEDAAQVDEKERARWRRQALDWLRADLNAYGKLLDGGKVEDRTLVRQRLRHWQRDADLSAIRETTERAKLPPDERQAYEKLWADVAALVKKAGQETK
jgi:tetratricopeptide (TPR) repeat protein